MNAIGEKLALDKGKIQEHNEDFFWVYHNEKESPGCSVNITLQRMTEISTTGHICTSALLSGE